MSSRAHDGGELILQISATSVSSSRYLLSPGDSADALGHTRIGRSLRYGDQAYFWTRSWQQAETLADYDYLAGMDYEPKDLDDLMEWLNSDD